MTRFDPVSLLAPGGRGGVPSRQSATEYVACWLPDQDPVTILLLR